MKLTPSLIALIVLAGAGAYYFSPFDSSKDVNTPGKKVANNSAQTKSAHSTDGGTGLFQDTSENILPNDLTPEQLLAEMQQIIDETTESAKNRDHLDAVTKKSMARKAYELVSQAAALNDKDVLKQFAKINPQCSWCSEFYQQVGNKLDDPSLGIDERAFIAKLLTQSGRADSAQKVVDLMQQAAANPQDGLSPAVYSKALEQGAPLTPEIVDQIGQDLASDNPYVREAAVSILTKQGTLAAAERLYQHTVELNNPMAYVHSGIGISEMTPKQEALGYLSDLVNQKDQYSSLAVRALLNYGTTGIDKVAALLDKVDEATARSLLKSAASHIALDQATVDHLNKVGQTSSQPAIKDLAAQIAEQRRIDIASRNKQIEFNQYTESGIDRNKFNPIFQR